VPGGKSKCEGERIVEMKTITSCAAIISLIFLFVIGCTKKPEQPVVIKTYPISSLDGIIAPEGIELDNEISADGNGSFKIVTPESTTVRLYETGDIDIENAKLVYKAKIRTEHVIGQAYLEMWCVFAGKGEFFSRGLNSLVAGDNDWTEIQTEFYLKEGENPDNLRLNLVVNGSGTVWIDDISLIKTPLRRDER
jgi:hypothetical protein